MTDGGLKSGAAIAASHGHLDAYMRMLAGGPVAGDACPMAPSVAKALVRAQRLVEQADKSSRATIGQGRGYAYASVETVAKVAKAAMSEAGLAVFPRGWDWDGETMCVAYWAVAEEDGASCLLGQAKQAIIPAAGRPWDKAVATALSNIHREFLRVLLNIPRFEPEADIEHRSDETTVPRPPSRQGHERWRVPFGPAQGKTLDQCSKDELAFVADKFGDVEHPTYGQRNQKIMDEISRLASAKGNQ